jgi:hypothetical protein
MDLTKEEFCLFNIKSKINLLNKDGDFLCRRLKNEKLLSLYKIYGFYIEVIFDIYTVTTIQINPVINPSIIELYKTDYRLVRTG